MGKMGKGVGKYNVVRVRKYSAGDCGEECLTAVPLLSTTLLLTVPVTCRQPSPENNKWKIPEINNVYIINYAPFKVA